MTDGMQDSPTKLWSLKDSLMHVSSRPYTQNWHGPHGFSSNSALLHCGTSLSSALLLILHNGQS